MCIILLRPMPHSSLLLDQWIVGGCEVIFFQCIKLVSAVVGTLGSQGMDILMAPVLDMVEEVSIEKKSFPPFL